MSTQKHVLITGVSSGIGYDALRFLIVKEYYVFGSVRKAEDANRLQREFPDNFGCLQFDVTQPAEIQAAYQQVETKLAGQRLAGLINNAGIAVGGPMELLSDAKFREQLEVNLFAVRNVTNTFLPLLKGDRENNIKGGKIIMISSISGIFSTPLLGAYCVSKHALESMADIYRRELMMYDIDVVAIRPGPIQSSIWEKSTTPYPEFENTDYAPALNKMLRMTEAAEKRALPTELISRLIYRILTQRTPAHIIVHRNRLLTNFFVKYWPTRWLDRIFYKRLFR